MDLYKNWKEYEYAVLDFEGTGPPHNKVVEIGLYFIKNGFIEPDYYYKLINPEMPIPSYVSSIHGLYDKDVVNMPPFSQISGEFCSLLSNKILISHNISVEKRILKTNLPSRNFPYCLDTLSFSKNTFKDLSDYSLAGLSKLLKLPAPNYTVNRTTFHNALYDAYTAAELFLKNISLNTRGDKLTLNDLISISKGNDLDNGNQKSLF